MNFGHWSSARTFYIWKGGKGEQQSGRPIRRKGSKICISKQQFFYVRCFLWCVKKLVLMISESLSIIILILTQIRRQLEGKAFLPGRGSCPPGPPIRPYFESVFPRFDVFYLPCSCLPWIQCNFVCSFLQLQCIVLCVLISCWLLSVSLFCFYSTLKI